MENELVSIIVPVYKVEKYIHKCVHSILNQSYDNLEIILVDDGSPDDCGKICDEMKLIDNRIVVIHQKNGGLSVARNTGINNAKGNYLAFVDSDDWIDANMIETMYTVAKENNSDLVICGINYYDGDGYLTKTISPKFTGNYTAVDALNNMQIDLRTPYISACTKFYKKSLFSNVLFPIAKINEDEFTAYRFIHKSYITSIINVPLYNTVYRCDSIMNSRYSVGRLDIIEALCERINYYNEYPELRELIPGVIKELGGAYAFGMTHFKPQTEKEIDRKKEIISMVENISNNYIFPIKSRIAVKYPAFYINLLAIREKIFNIF
jgi:glycosyltransferase involved in cell wall biosynthesis